jgi:hypothetical protein
MTITAKIARERTNEAKAKMEAALVGYAEALIENLVEPAIEEAIAEGKMMTTIHKAFFDGQSDWIMDKVFEILTNNGFTIFENADCHIEISW